jgi:error-prone DNA polymerase
VAAEEREQRLQAEVIEPAALEPMSTGRVVMEDYRSKGLSLRPHPLAFLRADLTQRRMAPCAALRRDRDGSGVKVAGLVLVGQKPGSAKGVMFITLEDETEVANLIVWPSLLERQRRMILSAGMLACRGRVREGEVIHLIAEHLIDLSDVLRSASERNEPFPVPHRRGDEARHGGGPDQRAADGLGRKPRDIYIPDLRAMRDFG